MASANSNKQLIGFFGVMGVVGLICLLMAWPFWQILALAGIFAVLFYPIFLKIYKEFKSENFAAALTIVIVVAVALLPLWFIGQLLFNEIVDVYNKFRLGEFVFNRSEWVNMLPQSLSNVAHSLSNDINIFISKFTGGAFNLVSGLLSNIASFFFSLFLLIFILFFFLRDGAKIKQLANELSPLSNVYDQALFEKIERAVGGIVKGQFLVALIQGCVATTGFFIFGVPQPILWGAFTVLAALVPAVGTSLSLIPAVIYLFLTHHTGAGIGMAIWAILAVGLVDNFVGPKIVGGRMNLHPLLVFISILGGIKLFGVFGFLFGPIIMAIFVTLVDIYRKDIKRSN
jgi:predicted PurR-regulated permease PerM